MTPLQTELNQLREHHGDIINGKTIVNVNRWLQLIESLEIAIERLSLITTITHPVRDIHDYANRAITDIENLICGKGEK